MLPKRSDPALAYELINLCIASYQQLADFQSGATWKWPEGYEVPVVLYAAYEGNQPPIGFIATKDKAIYITWRGTVLRQEWIEDAKTQQQVCPFLDDGSKTEVGFTQLYSTSRGPNHPSPASLVLDYLEKAGTGKTVYVTGHSLGASLAELNACDIAVNTAVAPIMYSFAAPRTGDPQFASTYNKSVSASWRVYNTNDPVPNSVPELVPAFPAPFYYVHVTQALPITFGFPMGGMLNHLPNGYADTFKRLAAEQQKQPVSGTDSPARTKAA